MFSDNSEEIDDDLKINEGFAAKFEHNQKRKEIERLEAKYGKNVNKIQEDKSYDSESDESEDSDAYLNTEKAESKFVDLINRIKTNDKTLLKMEGDYF